MRGGMLIGSSLGAVIMAICIHRLGFREAVVIQTLFLLVFTTFTFFVKEQKQDRLFSLQFSPANQAPDSRAKSPTLASIFGKLFAALFSKLSLQTFGTMALVYVCLSIFVRSLNVHLIKELHWTDTYLSTLSGSYVIVGAIAVMVVGGILADKIGARKLLLITMGIIGVYLLIFNLMAPLWSNRTLSSTGLLIWYMFDPSFSIAAMPILMNISHKDIAGSQFTTYMSLVNFTDVAGAYISGYAMLWLSAPTIGIFCGLFILIALLLQAYVGSKYGQRNGMPYY
jgi:PAT family beta-lactamase induction signal transducer AmpG